ncbi:MAG: acetoin dehydrogenase dihydrolipoyllysine-residue acetyltransferase subunit [Gammaproteobacteria bacterium]|nr:acetoin dehydrogenase dihydrolipoyllysine-residue acetyltransferase subunit [Gammaproteobacteria bacterium]
MPGSKARASRFLLVRIVEVETEKIVNAVEADTAGILVRRVAEEGDTIVVGGLLGVMAERAEIADDSVDVFVAEYQEHFKSVAAEEGTERSAEPVDIEVGGRKMRYLELGSGEKTIDGMGGDLNGWMFNQPALAEHYRVLALDLLAHGGSVKELETGSLEELAAAVLVLLDAVGVDEAHFVGHSLGGAVTVQLAAEAGDRVNSVTLIGSAGAGTPVSRSYIDGFIGANRRKDLKPILKQLFADPELVNRDMINDVLKAKRLDGVEVCWRKIADASIFSVEDLTPEAVLGKLSMPLQIIWGKEDRVATRPEERSMPENVVMHVLDDVGHMPQLEAAGVVNDLIKTLVDGGNS